MINPDEIYQRIYDAGVEWADKHAAAQLLEDMQKTVLADCLLAQKQLNEKLAYNILESKARATDVYTKHLDSMVTARKEANRARVKYDSAKIWFEAARSVESTKRAEMNLK